MGCDRPPRNGNGATHPLLRAASKRWCGVDGCESTNKNVATRHGMHVDVVAMRGGYEGMPPGVRGLLHGRRVAAAASPQDMTHATGGGPCTPVAPVARGGTEWQQQRCEQQQQLYISHSHTLRWVSIPLPTVCADAAGVRRLACGTVGL